MKRFTSAMMVGALAVLVAASPARAQYVFFGGGLTIPVGDFKDIDQAKTGWMATGGIGVDIGKKGLWIEAEGFYGSNKHDDGTGDKTNIIAGLGALGYSFTPDKSVSPYVLAGVGILAHQFKPATGSGDTESKFAYTGAVGLGINASPKVHLFIEARFLGGKDTNVIPILAGLSIQFGK